MDQSSPRQLSKECIEAIKKAYHYETIPYTTLEGAEEALTNPSIFSKAGLISLEDAEQLALENWTQGVKDGLASKGFISLQDALRFGMWASSRIKAVLNDSLCVTHDNKAYNHSQLFQIYQDDK